MIISDFLSTHLYRMENYKKHNFGGKHIYQVCFNLLLDFLKVKYVYLIVLK